MFLIWHPLTHILFRGKMGASLHRSSKEKAVGGEPPYLMVINALYFWFCSFIYLLFLVGACISRHTEYKHGHA